MARLDRVLAAAVGAVLLISMCALPAGAQTAKVVGQFNRLVLKRNYEKSAAVLKVAAKAGDAESQYRLASLYRIGLGVTRDEARALDLLRRASNAGHVRAARLLSQLESRPRQSTEVVRWPEKGDRQTFVPSVKVESKDGAGNNWLTRAAARGQIKTLSSFASSAGRSPFALLAAAAAGQNESTLLLLRSGAPVNTTDSEGRTALMLSAASSSPVLTANLISSGADIAQQDIHGRNALHFALGSCNVEAALALLRNNTSLRAIPQAPPLLQLAITGCPNADIIAALLPHVDVDAADNEGRTALWQASALGNVQTAALLIAHHANVNQLDRDGMTPLHAGALRCQPDSLDLLLKNGANPDTATRDGNTPLMLAAASDCTVGLALLVAARASIDAVNQQGDAALLIAVRAGSVGAVKLLLGAGATPDARNVRRETAASVAKRLGRTEIANLLPPP